MGQHSGRIHIKVKDPKDWLKLKGLPKKLLDGAIAFSWWYDIDEISVSNTTDVVLVGEGEVCFGDVNMGRRIDKTFDPSYVCDMCSVVKALAVALEDRAIIIADATYNGSDMCTSRVCYLGGNLKYEYFSFGKEANLFSTANIKNVSEWLVAGGFKIDSSEKTYLHQFNINLDNYQPSYSFGLSRQIRVLKKNAPVVAPVMDKEAVGKIVSSHSDAIRGKTFVVTGKLYHFANRNELKTLIESNGAKLSETLNSSTNYLITNEPNSGSSKIIKAQSLGISIISEEDLLNTLSSDDKSSEQKNEDGEISCTTTSSKKKLEVVEGTADSLSEGSSQNSNATTRTDEDGIVPARDLILVKRLKKYVIKGYTGGKTNIILPDNIDGIPIVGISSKAFAMKRDVPHNSKIKSITLPSSLEFIDQKAFYHCASLEEIVLPKTLLKIGFDAFGLCKKLKRVVYTGDIKDWCNIDFDDYTSNPLSQLHVELIVNNSIVSNVVIPDDIIEVKPSIFCGSNIESVTLGKNVEIIGKYAFRFCRNLTSVTIPDSVTSIGNYAFEYCNSLKYNEYNNGKYLGNTENPYVVLVNVIDTSAANFTIQDTTKVVYEEALKFCENLTSVTIPDSVTSIEHGALWACGSLTSITIPNSIKNIGPWAFRSCTSLTSITFEGAKAEWNAITKGTYWNDDIPATEIICFDGVVSLT